MLTALVLRIMGATIDLSSFEPSCLVGEMGQVKSDWVKVKMMAMWVVLFMASDLVGQDEWTERQRTPAGTLTKAYGVCADMGLPMTNSASVGWTPRSPICILAAREPPGA
jgi:hypothetical protein